MTITFTPLSILMFSVRINAKQPVLSPRGKTASFCDKVTVAGLLVAFLATINLIQRSSVPLTGCIAGENKGVKPHGFCTVLKAVFMCWRVQLSTI